MQLGGFGGVDFFVGIYAATPKTLNSVVVSRARLCAKPNTQRNLVPYFDWSEPRNAQMFNRGQSWFGSVLLFQLSIPILHNHSTVPDASNKALIGLSGQLVPVSWRCHHNASNDK